MSRFSSNRRYFMIVNEATGMAVDFGCGDTGNSVVMRRVHDGEGQIFYRDGSFICAAPSGKVLDLARDTRNIVVWAAHGGTNQSWVVHADGTIRSAEGSDLCFDVHRGSTDEGARVIAYPFHGGANQRFRLNEVRGVSVEYLRRRDGWLPNIDGYCCDRGVYYRS